MKRERRGGRRSDVWVVLIGLFKLVKAVSLTTIAVLLVTPEHRKLAGTMARFSTLSQFNGAHLHLAAWTEKLNTAGERSLRWIALWIAVYAALFLLEGIGLLSRKRWGEYVTIVITGSFVPIECWEAARHLTAARVVLTAVNIAIVVYLIVRVRAESRSETRARRRGPHSGPVPRPRRWHAGSVASGASGP